MKFLPKARVKIPIKRKQVMGEVALIADKFLILAGRVELFEALLAHN